MFSLEETPILSFPLPHTNTQSFYFSPSPTSPYLTPNPLVLQLIIILFDTRGHRKTMHAYKIINDVTSGAMWESESGLHMQTHCFPSVIKSRHARPRGLPWRVKRPTSTVPTGQRGGCFPWTRLTRLHVFSLGISSLGQELQMLDIGVVSGPARALDHVSEDAVTSLGCLFL